LMDFLPTLGRFPVFFLFLRQRFLADGGKFSPKDKKIPRTTKR